MYACYDVVEFEARGSYFGGASDGVSRARAAEEAAARGVRALVSKSAAATQVLHAEVEGGKAAFLGPEPRDYVREAMQQARS